MHLDVGVLREIVVQDVHGDRVAVAVVVAAAHLDVEDGAVPEVERGAAARGRDEQAEADAVLGFDDYADIAGADVCIVTTGVAEGAEVGPELSLIGKRGRVVVTAIGHPEETTITTNLLELTLYEKQIRGSLFGSSNGQHDIPRLLELYALGQLKLDELITTEYDLEDINQGYEDMRSGRNIRGVIRY